MSENLNIIFAGTPDFAAVSLQSLIASRHNVIAVYTQPDRPAGRGQKVQASAVKKIAQKEKIPIFQPKKLGADEIAQYSNLNSDVMVVSAYGLLLPKELLTIPKYGCINIHASLLPKWRGAAPIQRAIIAGDKQTGITIMQITEELDAGPILLQSKCDIHPSDTGKKLHDRLANLSSQEIIYALDCLQRNELVSKEQDAAQATYAKKLTKKEANINWQESAIEIERKIRAYNTWPVAYSYFQGQRVRIWEAKPSEMQCNKIPGTVISATNEGVEVCTGKGVLSLTLLQLSGGKIISAQDFKNAHETVNKCFSNIQDSETLKAHA